MSETVETTETPAAKPVEPRKIAVCGEMPFAGKALVKALLEKGFAVRALCPDEKTELAIRSVANAETGARLEIVPGGLDSDVRVAELMSGGVYGAALVSPVGLQGRLYRSKEHLEDVKRVAQAAEKAALRKLVYHSSTSAHPESRARSLSDAAMGESIIKESRCEDFVIRTPPLMGRNDGLIQPAIERIRSGSLFMSIWGYGGTVLTPLHADDFARCILRVFVDEPHELQPNVYLAAGPERTSPLDLYDAASEKLGTFRIKFHLPLFILRMLAGAQGGTFAEGVELLFELDEDRRNPQRMDTETLLGRGAKLANVGQTVDEIMGTSVKAG